MPAVFAGRPISIDLYDVYKIGGSQIYILKDTFKSVEIYLAKFEKHKYLAVNTQLL